MLDAIAAVKAALPGWWYSMGYCALTCHASVGPDFRSPLCDLSHVNLYDDGFHADLPPPATMADALRNAAQQAVEAILARVPG